MYNNGSTQKEAMEYLVNLGNKTAIVDVDGTKFSTEELYEVKETVPVPNPLSVATLTGLIDYIKSESDKKATDNLILHIQSVEKVALYSELRKDAVRECYMISQALTPRIYYDRFLDTEQFNIMLQSSFVDNKDKDLLLKVTGNVQDEAVKQVGDNGVTQSVTMKTGVATMNEVVVPNPVVLAPYRTFPEIDQVESKFIFRMKEGPSAAIFEADGGAWRNEAMKRIKEYLEKELKDIANIKVIS